MILVIATDLVLTFDSKKSTIEYINQLEAKITALETNSTSIPHQSTSTVPSPRQGTFSPSFSPLSPSNLNPLPSLIEGYEPANNRVSGNHYHAAFSQPQHFNPSFSSTSYPYPPLPSPTHSNGSSDSILSNSLPLPITLAPIRADLNSRRNSLQSIGNGRETEQEIATGLLLLKYSCSPELRPVVYE